MRADRGIGTCLSHGADEQRLHCQRLVFSLHDSNRACTVDDGRTVANLKGWGTKVARKVTIRAGLLNLVIWYQNSAEKDFQESLEGD